MQITLDLDDDLIEAMLAIATREHKSLDRILVDLARIGLREQSNPPAPSAQVDEVRHGFRVLPRRGDVVTPQHVRRLLDEEGA